MPSLTVTEPHSLGQEQAIARLKSFGETLKAEHGDKIRDVSEVWTANVLLFEFTAAAPGRDVEVRGVMTVEDSRVSIEGEIPWKAMFHKGQIESTIRENLKKALGLTPEIEVIDCI